MHRRANKPAGACSTQLPEPSGLRSASRSSKRHGPSRRANCASEAGRGRQHPARAAQHRHSERCPLPWPALAPTTTSAHRPVHWPARFAAITRNTQCRAPGWCRRAGMFSQRPPSVGIQAVRAIVIANALGVLSGSRRRKEIETRPTEDVVLRCLTNDVVRRTLPGRLVRPGGPSSAEARRDPQPPGCLVEANQNASPAGLSLASVRCRSTSSTGQQTVEGVEIRSEPRRLRPRRS